MGNFKYGYKANSAYANYTADISQSFVLYQGENEIARGNRKHVDSLVNQLRKRNPETKYTVMYVMRSLTF